MTDSITEYDQCERKKRKRQDSNGHSELPLMFNPPTHCVFELTGDQTKDDAILIEAQRCVISEGIALVHTHWQDNLISYPSRYDEDADFLLNRTIVEFVQRLGGVVNLHNHDSSTSVWDVRPVQEAPSDSTAINRPARSLTAEAFDMHTVRKVCIYVLPISMMYYERCKL